MVLGRAPRTAKVAGQRETATRAQRPSICMSFSSFKSKQYVRLSNSLLTFAILFSKRVAIFFPLKIHIFSLYFNDLFTNKFYGFCKAGLWTKLLHHDQSPPESVIIISFFLFQIWQIYQKLWDLIKIVPSFPSQIFPLLWSTMHLFTMIFYIYLNSSQLWY